MIPILRANEPANFDTIVRQPGHRFLAKTANPTEKQWKGKEYWQKSLVDMRLIYSKICSYSACWIPHSTGSHSIDHFVPKMLTPALAYEWKNFRYVSTRFNSRKGIKVVVDPFDMKFHWFTIDFATFFIMPNDEILDEIQLLLAKDTITILKFNEDEELVNERYSYYEDYKNHHIDMVYLRKVAPFIAYEIQRQNLL
jgi:hypothetical protein